MSKDANLIVAERERIAKEKEKQEDAIWWQHEQAGHHSPKGKKLGEQHQWSSPQQQRAQGSPNKGQPGQEPTSQAENLKMQLQKAPHVDEPTPLERPKSISSAGPTDPFKSRAAIEANKRPIHKAQPISGELKDNLRSSSSWNKSDNIDSSSDLKNDLRSSSIDSTSSWDSPDRGSSSSPSSMYQRASPNFTKGAVDRMTMKDNLTPVRPMDDQSRSIRPNLANNELARNKAERRRMWAEFPSWNDDPDSSPALQLSKQMHTSVTDIEHVTGKQPVEVKQTTIPLDRVKEITPKERRRIEKEQNVNPSYTVMMPSDRIHTYREVPSREIVPDSSQAFDQDSPLERVLSRSVEDSQKHRLVLPNYLPPDSRIPTEHDVGLFGSIRASLSHTKDRVVGTLEHAKDKVEDSLESAKEKVEDSIDTVKEKVEDSYDAVKHKLKELKEDAKESMHETKELIIEKKDHVVDRLQDAKDDVVEKGHELKEDITIKERELKLKARDMKDDVVIKGRELKSDIDVKSRDAQLKARDMKDDAVLKGRQAQAELRFKGHKLSDDIAEKKEDVLAKGRELKNAIINKSEDLKESIKDTGDDLKLAAGSTKDHIVDDLDEASHQIKHAWWNPFSYFRRHDVKAEVEREIKLKKLKAKMHTASLPSKVGMDEPVYVPNSLRGLESDTELPSPQLPTITTTSMSQPQHVVPMMVPHSLRGLEDSEDLPSIRKSSLDIDLRPKSQQLPFVDVRTDDTIMGERSELRPKKHGLVHNLMHMFDRSPVNSPDRSFTEIERAREQRIDKLNDSARDFWDLRAQDKHQLIQQRNAPLRPVDNMTQQQSLIKVMKGDPVFKPYDHVVADTRDIFQDRQFAELMVEMME